MSIIFCPLLTVIQFLSIISSPLTISYINLDFLAAEPIMSLTVSPGSATFSDKASQLIIFPGSFFPVVLNKVKKFRVSTCCPFSSIPLAIIMYSPGGKLPNKVEGKFVLPVIDICSLEILSFAHVLLSFSSL